MEHIILGILILSVYIALDYKIGKKYRKNKAKIRALESSNYQQVENPNYTTQWFNINFRNLRKDHKADSKYILNLHIQSPCEDQNIIVGNGAFNRGLVDYIKFYIQKELDKSEIIELNLIKRQNGYVWLHTPGPLSYNLSMNEISTILNGKSVIIENNTSPFTLANVDKIE